MVDLLLRNGTVVDGTGAPPRVADVAVHGDRITAIEPHYRGPAQRVIDARGHVVSPGFIDVKTHSDFALPLYPLAESRVHQGITTELVGSCGFTAAPVPAGRHAAVADYLAAMAPALKFRETSFANYLESFPATSVNVATQVGHNTVRVAVMGLERRAPTPDEQAAMERLVEEALDAGAVGVSSGPFTAPGAFAQPQELEALAGIAARRGAGYATHLRDESNHVFDAMREAVAVAERTGARTRIVHVKVSGADNWGGAARLLDELSAARKRGVAIDCDQYPYTAALNPLRNLLPSWAQEGGVARLLERLADTKVRDDMFARVLGHYTRDRGLLTLEQAVYKMTGGAAAALGLVGWASRSSWRATPRSQGPTLADRVGGFAHFDPRPLCGDALAKLLVETR